MTGTETADRSTAAPTPGTILQRGAIAAALAALANAAIVLGASAAGVAPNFRALTIPPVVFLTIVGVAGATLVFWVLARRRAAPEALFTRVAIAVLVVSLLPDVALLGFDPAATVAGVLVLMVMHVVAAAVSVAALTGRLGF